MHARTHARTHPLTRVHWHGCGRGEELPRFEVELQFLPALRERVKLAKQIMKIEKRISKVNRTRGSGREEGWCV